MSDLQCAATVLLVDGTALSTDGRLLTSLAKRRVLTVYASADPPALQAAERAAERLGVPCRALPGVQGVRDGESDLVTVDRFRRALEEVADGHRGETVLLVSHGDAIALVVPRLASYGPPREHRAPSVTELLIDGDGWALVS